MRMKWGQSWGVGLIAAVIGFGPVANASAQVQPPATGFSIWARLAQSSVQELAASASGSPEFTIGFRGATFSFGLGLGLAKLRVTDKDVFGPDVSETTTTATLFQIGPDVLWNVWNSADQRTLGNVVLGATIGKLSAKVEDTFNGTVTNEDKVSGTLYGLRAGLGGEHFFDRHFAIGVEGGFQANFATGIEEEGATRTIGVAANGAYGALRVTVVLSGSG